MEIDNGERVSRWRERFEIVGGMWGEKAEPWGSAFLFYSTRTYVDTYPRRRPSPRENQNFI